MIDIKICGLKDPAHVELASELGARWIGFVLAEASPRHVSLAEAVRLMPHLGRAASVALLVDPSDAAVQSAAEAGFDILQLHGAETPERVAEIKAQTGLEVWKAVGVSSPADLKSLTDFSTADRLLLDAKPPQGDAQTGGHGRAFDWSILSGWQALKPWILAGGLTPENVQIAIEQTGAKAVDVSSGVERARGEKSADLIRAFITTARAIQHH